MASLSTKTMEDHQDLVTVLRAPGGIPLRVEGGSHICTPYASGEVEAVQMRGAKKLEALMAFCGLRVGAVPQADTQRAMQLYYEKMFDGSVNFKRIFQQADAAKKLCP